jgi:hypothetical protein
VNRDQLNSFLGLPTDGGMHAAGGAFGASGLAASPEGAVAGRAGAEGHVYQGPMGTTVAHGATGARGAAFGPGGAAAGGAFASGTAVKGPEGNVYTHDTTAARGIAAGPGGVEGGREFSSGSTFQGAGGTTAARGVSGAQGFAAGSYGAAAGRGYAYGTHAWSPTYYHAQALAGQNWFAGNPIFSAGWTAAHPWAWYPGAYAPAAWAATAWNAANWPAVGTWLGWGDVSPYAYDYGDSIVYDNGNVYYGNQPAGTTTQYYQEAANLAGNGGTAQPSQDTQWLPLGVFSLMPPGAKTPAYVVQLAVDKNGVVRGNCYEEATKATVPVQGAVDKRTQRVAWRIGGNKDMVFETGLYSLTQNESTALVHQGSQKTVQYLLARVKQPTDGQVAQQPN